MKKTRKFTVYRTLGMYDTFEIAQLREDTKADLLECGYKEEDITDELIDNRMYEDNFREFEYLLDRLSKELDGRILCFGTLGKWNGSTGAYKIMGRNLSEVLSSCGCDEFIIGSNGYDIMIRGYHHDGNNAFTFREIREGKNIDNLLNKIYNNESIKQRDINYYTKSLNREVAEVL